MAIRRSNQRRDGRYVYGGKVEVRGDRLGWWERQTFASSPTDITHIITKKYANRPDLLAYDLYGRANLMWFVLQYNNIIDVSTEFVEGATIILPTSRRLFSELLISTVK